MRSLEGVKQCASSFLRNLLLRFPILGPIFNQILAHDLGILSAWHLVLRAGISGDYFEFGVFRGETFLLSLRAHDRLKKILNASSAPRCFFAFDSFQGLPNAAGKQEGGFYKEGEFKASLKEFNSHLGKWSKDPRVKIVPGWFKDSLTKNAARAHTSKAAFIVIDCDLYESTAQVLEYITPLVQTGTLLYFDDWFSIRASLHLGESKACREWLAKNPQIELVEYKKIGITGVLFLVQLKGDIR